MNLETTCKKCFSWNDQQWIAFLELCSVMECGEQINTLILKEYSSEIAVLEQLNPILQDYLFRAGKENPFGASKKRYQITDTEYTEKHRKAAEALISIEIHKTKLPEASLHANAVFVLGSTVPNMIKRLEFAKEHVFPNLAKVSERPIIMGLSGERKLIPAKQDGTQGYLGDFSEGITEGQHLLTKFEAESTIQRGYQKEGQSTEAGAMSLLGDRIIPKEWSDVWVVIDAPAKVGKDRPDTEDTAYYAGKFLKEKGSLSSELRVAIVSDAAFPGQKEQVLSGLYKAGLTLQDDQVIFCGIGYPESIFKVPAYVQIGVSAIAEQAFNLLVRLKLQPELTEEVNLAFTNMSI